MAQEGGCQFDLNVLVDKAGVQGVAAVEVVPAVVVFAVVAWAHYVLLHIVKGAMYGGGPYLAKAEAVGGSGFIQGIHHLGVSFVFMVAYNGHKFAVSKSTSVPKLHAVQIHGISGTKVYPKNLRSKRYCVRPRQRVQH